MTKTIWIVGAGVESIHGIKLAKRFGLNVVVSDGNPNAPGLKFADKSIIVSTYNIEETVSAAYEYNQSVSSIDGVICIATDVPLTVASIAEKYSDHVFVTSDNPRYENLDGIIGDILTGFNIANHSIIHDRAKAITKAMQLMNEDTILLVMGKGHENYEEVDGHKIPHSDCETIQNFGNEITHSK